MSDELCVSDMCVCVCVCVCIVVNGREPENPGIKVKVLMVCYI